MLPLIALDALDDDLRRCALLRLASFRCFGFGGFLLGVLFRTLLGVDAKGREVLGGGVGGVELGVEGWVFGFQPVGTFLGRAAEFTVL